MTYTRRTLQSSVIFEGLGLHSGGPVRVTVHPGQHGIAFRSGGARIPAVPENVVDTQRCTRLQGISTIEHLMSAFCGLEVTDAEVEVEGGELPGLDGSARQYVQRLHEVGFEALGEAQLRQPFSRVFLQDLPVKIGISRGEGHWRYTFGLTDHFPREQTFESADVTADYEPQIAPARTIVTDSEAQAILAHNLPLGRGLGEESVVVLEPEGYKYAPRFPDEPARHKLLDLMGDLYLAGVPARFLNVVAEKSGHRTNVEAAARLMAALG